MLIRKVYRFKLRVNHPDTAARLHQFSGCTRFVWNKMLAMNLYSPGTQTGVAVVPGNGVLVNPVESE